MIKLKTTSSKDTYMAILDILDIQGIPREQNTTLDENSNWLYTVYINETDLEKAEALLKVDLWEEAKEDYGQYGADILMDELIYHTQDDEEKRETVLNTLKEKGETTDSIQQKIAKEIKDAYWEQQTITKFEIVMGFVELLLIGGPTFRLGKKIYFEKYTHPITKEKIYVYDDYSRKYGLLFMILGTAVFVGLSLYAYLIFFND